MVNTKDIKKHKKDVFLLMSLVNPDTKIETSGSVRNAVERFVTEIMADSFQPKDININRSNDGAGNALIRLIAALICIAIFLPTMLIIKPFILVVNFIKWLRMLIFMVKGA